MDKIAEYKKIVRSLVEEVVSWSNDEEDGIENQLITDDEHGHYIYAGVGWEKEVNKWFYANFIHVDVRKDGSVWIQHDGTDLRIAERLITEGIDRKDIVIGFHPPHARA
jgi:hypothetical protein